MQTVRDTLIDQFGIAWSLAWYHLETLTTEECLWSPADRGLHVNLNSAGVWSADWPEHESYDIGPPSIAWTTWHICFWWQKSLEHVEGTTTLTHQNVTWPGSADAVRAVINGYHGRWVALLTNATASDMATPISTSWPRPNSSLESTAAWLNIELTKNAAEIGYVRFLYAARSAR